MDEEQKPTVTMLGAALWFAEQGLRVFPLSPGSKIPFKGSSGCLSATSNTELIRDWWDRDPDSNIGIATGHLVDVVDIDGPAGQASRAAHWCAKGPECETRGMKELPWHLEDCDHGPGIFGRIDADKVAVVTTPRPGGLHIYVPANGQGNSASILPGIDIRGAGGYVCAPPSVLIKGRCKDTDTPGTYRFLGTPNFPKTG